VEAAEAKLAELRERPPSPCINVCRLDERGLCVGCLRSGAEIGRWTGMSAQEQWQLLGVLEARRNLSKQVT
jgi:predicted Fe-S protein YdhL (DUF1289 family)